MEQHTTVPASQHRRANAPLGLNAGLVRVISISILAILAYVGIYILVQYQLDKAVKTEVRLATNIGLIKYYDEALTMSARMAAATNDLTYEARYNQLVTELDAVLAETLALAPDDADISALQTVEQANLTLVGLEGRALTLARQGRGAEGLALITSEEYQRNKRVYAQGTDTAFNAILEAERQVVQRWEAFGYGAGILAVIGLLSSVVLIVRSLQQQVAAQNEAITLAAQATAAAQDQTSLNDSLQRQIVHLLDEVSGAAEGDLTVEAEVTDGSLGAVADSFNYMISELRGIIGRVNNATQQVGSSTDEILTTTDTLSRSAEDQALRIADTSTAVEEMAVSIQQVSENAAISAQVAREARASAAQGTEAVAATITGMGRVRQQVQETSRKIERLAASSQEIEKIVSIIRDLADQTQVLALNAAIQAAAAGEHGRGFAVVAEEVRRLAQRTTNASGQIATLVKGIQAETSEAIVAMEDGTTEVTTGAQVAEEAGQKLEQIDTTVAQLTELIEAISLAAEQQARASAGIARAMGDISSATTSTSAGTQQAAASVAALAALADDLRASVATFRLGNEDGLRAGGQAGMPRSAYAGVGD